jgi:hypothetical protein
MCPEKGIYRASIIHNPKRVVQTEWIRPESSYHDHSKNIPEERDRVRWDQMTINGQGIVLKGQGKDPGNG